jgi:hypothetical protein
MNDTSAHIATLDQADEEILTYAVSDDALEAAAGMEMVAATGLPGWAQCNSGIWPSC